MVVYIYYDHMFWFSSAGIIQGDSKNLKYRSVNCWFYAILIQFISNTIQLWRASSDQIHGDTEKRASAQVAKNRALRQYIKLIPDLIVSATFAEKTKLFNNDALIAILSIISALFGLYTTWPTTGKRS
eukprot:TRINITY_DN5208_c0_g2_i1.p1 TRINITY_DN5208_c0_g2~~TRINITY_DN5208_c0_g2_i1.p1  ORF type:complete len:128 (-),score=15.06 TRINITY_DN5208_c0_g2_i1:144-527(-)